MAGDCQGQGLCREEHYWEKEKKSEEFWKRLLGIQIAGFLNEKLQCHGNKLAVESTSVPVIGGWWTGGIRAQSKCALVSCYRRLRGTPHAQLKRSTKITLRSES